MITAGWNGYHGVADTEAFVISFEGKHHTLSRCFPHLQSTVGISTASGGLLRSSRKLEHDNPATEDISNNGPFSAFAPVICGGLDELGLMPNMNCYQIKDSSSKPKVVGWFSHARESAASIVIQDGTTLWVTGGLDVSSYTNTETTEWIHIGGDTDATTVGYGINLPQALSHHCLERIHSGLAIVVGGLSASTNMQIENSWSLKFTDDTVLTNSKGGGEVQWEPGARLKIPRHSQSCGVLKFSDSSKVVVAAGGELYDNGEQVTNTVEFLRVNGKSSVLGSFWEEGPKMPFLATTAGSATTEDQTSLLVAGGTSSQDPWVIYTGIGKLSCYAGSCKWTLLDLELVNYRDAMIAMIIPAKRPMDGSILTEHLSEGN